jgi:hypothetical protein
MLSLVALRALQHPCRDRGIGHYAALPSSDRMQIASGGSLSKTERGQQNQLKRDWDELPHHHKVLSIDTGDLVVAAER